MPIPAGDLTKLRGKRQWIRPVVDVFRPEVVATATVSATPASYPIGEISVSGTSGWGDIEIGQLVVVKDSDDVVTYGVVRKSPTASVLYIDGKSRGDPGRALTVIRALQAGQSVTIYNFQPLWALLSRISGGVFYKKYDIPYDGSGANPNPVVNIGAWKIVRIGSNGLAEVSYNNNSSFAWDSKTLSTWSWTIPSVATITGGGLSSANITFTVPPGFYLIRCQIMDSGGAIFEGTRPLWVYNSTTYKPLSDRFAIAIESDREDLTGRSMTIRVTGSDLTETTILPGSAFIVSEESSFDDSSLSTGILTDTYVGFIGAETQTMEIINGQKSIVFEVKSPISRMSDIPMVSQAIIETTSPSNWTEVKNGLGTPGFISWYILKHHTTYLELFDLYDLDDVTPPRKKNWGLNGSTVYDYVKQVGAIIAGNIGCASDGSMWLRRDPNIEEGTYRNLLDLRLTITGDDLAEPIELNENFFPSVGQLRAFAFQYTGGEPVAVASIAPGFVQGQAPGKQDEDSLIIQSADPQDKINRVAGHLYAKNNSATPEIGLKLMRNMDVMEPAKMLWMRLNIPAEYNPRGQAINSRCILLSVDRSWVENNGEWLKEVSWTVSAETQGQPGETLLINQGGGSVYPPQDPFDLEAGRAIDEFDDYFGFLIAINDSGRLGRTFNGLNWEPIDTGFSGTVCDFDFNYFSPRVTSGWSVGNLGMWALVSDNSGNLEIYYTENVLGASIIWESQGDYVMNDSSVITSARIRASRLEQDFVAIAWNDRSGVYVGRSIDAGTTWAAPVTIFSDTNGCPTHWDDQPLGFDIYGEVQVVSTRTSTLESSGHKTGPSVSFPSSYGQIYYATSKTGGFSISGYTTFAYKSFKCFTSLVFDGQGTLYVGTPFAQLLANWDDAYAPIPTATAGAYAVAEIASGGNPGNQAQGRITGSLGTPSTQTISMHLSTGFQLIGRTRYLSYDFRSSGTFTSVREYQFDFPYTSSLIHTFTPTEMANNEWVSYGPTAPTQLSSGGTVMKLVFNLFGATIGHTGGFDNFAYHLGGGIERIDEFATSPYGTSVAPSSYFGTLDAQSVNIDSTNDDGLIAAVYDGSDMRVYVSDNQGASWTYLAGLTDYYGAKRAGDILLLFGDEKLDFSDDLGSSLVDLLGDWEDVFGNVGIIRNVRGVF